MILWTNLWPEGWSKLSRLDHLIISVVREEMSCVCYCSQTTQPQSFRAGARCPAMGVHSRPSQSCTEFNLLEIYRQKHDLQVDFYDLGQTTFTTWGFLQQSGKKWLHSSWNVPGLSQANIKESGIFLAPGSSPPGLHTALMDLAIYGMLRNYLWETNQDYSRVTMTAITQHDCCQITLNP